MTDNAAPGSATGNIISSNNDSAAGNSLQSNSSEPVTIAMLERLAVGWILLNNVYSTDNAPQSKNNSQPLPIELLDNAVDRLDALVAKHFQEGAGELSDDAHHQATPGAPFQGLRHRDDNGDFNMRSKLSALNEYMDTIPSVSADSVFLRNMIRSSDLAMEKLTREAQHYSPQLLEVLATDVMMDCMVKEDPSLISIFDSDYLGQYTEAKNRAQAAAALADKKMEEKPAPTEKDVSKAMEG